MAEKVKRNYKDLDEKEFYRIANSRGVVKVSEEQSTKGRTVSFAKEFNTGEKWVPRKGKFFSISFNFIGKVIDILIGFGKKFGWKMSSLEKPEEKIVELKRQLDDTLRNKSEIEQLKDKLVMDIQEYKAEIKRLRNDVIKENFANFEKDINDFSALLKSTETEKAKEETLQSFLKEHPWMFSPEYYKVKPKKPVGSKSIFDFYLEDYKGQGTIIELELPTDLIFSSLEEYGMSPKCGTALGQLIRYIETTIATSHSAELKKIEQIDETKPLGFLIIGRTRTEEEVRKLKVINSFLHTIEIMSYDLLLARAKSYVEPWMIKNAKTKVEANGKQ